MAPNKRQILRINLCKMTKMEVDYNNIQGDMTKCNLNAINSTLD
jgi:hypothetical protein